SRVECLRLFHHAGIDSWQYMQLSALEIDSSAVSLFLYMRRLRHHALDAGDLRRRSHDDVEIWTIVKRVFFDDEPEAGNHPSLFRFLWSLERHEDDRVVVIVLADAFQFVNQRNPVFLQLRFRTHAREHEDLW